MKIKFENLPHEAYISSILCADVPAIISVSNEIKIIFNDVFEKSYECCIDNSFIDSLVQLPIIKVGGKHAIYGNVLLNIKQSSSGEFEIFSMKIFINSNGWFSVVENGVVIEHEREPDPDWL